MIPKTIHYCWFGGNEMPPLALKCIRSWKKYAKGFEIVEWNEDNFDLESCPAYVKDAYKEKKWAFVTDYARLKILYDNGGIYFDTDVEVVRDLTPLLTHRCFMGIERAKDCAKVASGLGIGAEKGFALIREMMDDYNDRSFYKEDGSIDITTCTVINTEVLKRHGFTESGETQEFMDGVVAYAPEYFSPMDMTNGKMYRTKNTYSIHHYGLSWTSEEHRAERKKYLRRAKWLDFCYNMKVLPNTILQKLMGKKRYEAWKSKIKK